MVVVREGAVPVAIPVNDRTHASAIGIDRNAHLLCGGGHIYLFAYVLGIYVTLSIDISSCGVTVDIS